MQQSRVSPNDKQKLIVMANTNNKITIINPRKKLFFLMVLKTMM